MGLVLLKELNNGLYQSKDSDSYNKLIMAINALPSIHVLDHSFYFEKYIIFFQVDKNSQDGLFFLSRATCNRYWQYGNKWSIVVDASDSIYSNGDLPILYMLRRDIAEHESIDDVQKEVDSLYANLNYHINLEKYTNGYNLDLTKFRIVDEIAYNRDKKLKNIGI